MCRANPLQPLTLGWKASPRIGLRTDIVCPDRAGTTLLSACVCWDQAGKLAPNLGPVGLLETRLRLLWDTLAGETAM